MHQIFFLNYEKCNFWTEIILFSTFQVNVPTQHQVVRNHQMANRSSSSVNMDPNSLIQKSHSVPNVNGHVQKNRNTTAGSNNSNNYHNLLNENKQKYSFNAADGDDPGILLIFLNIC